MIHESGKKMLNLLFNEGETVCVSDDGYGYHSIPLENLGYEVVELESPNEKVGLKTIRTEDLLFVAINPTKGRRMDENCTAFRTFMVEMDEGDLATQLRYVRDMGMPYSACVYSGGKSLHFAITLDKDLPNYEVYYYLSTWILSIMAKADTNTKNPTRSIRMPGALRKGKEQKLVEMMERVSLDDLNAWLSKFEGNRPVGIYSQEKRDRPPDGARTNLIPRWVWKALGDGVDREKSRNVEWFKISSEFGKAGFDCEETIDILDSYFQPEYDFKRAEWITTVRSGVRNGQKKAGFD